MRRGDNVVLSPAADGGYTLIGLSKPHARLFADIPWSTSEVYRLTLERAREIGLPVVEVPGWYDVDDASLAAACSRPSLPASARPSRQSRWRRSTGDTGFHARASRPRPELMHFPSGDKIVSVIIPCLNEEAPIAGRGARGEGAERR